MNIRLRGGMLSVERVIRASPAAVWSVLTDLEDWPKWGLTVSGAELLDGDELGLGERGVVRTSRPFDSAVDLEPSRPAQITQFLDAAFCTLAIVDKATERFRVLGLK